MDLVGEYRIPAPRQTVWEALNDPDILKECIPGCQSLEKTGDDTMAATVISKIGPVKATFKGEVRLENLNPPESYSIVGEGKGGVAGFAKGAADVKLAEDGEVTVLTYEAKAQVGGKLAQLGSRLIDSTAKKMADDFFGAFSEKVGGAPPAGETVTEAEVAEPAAAPSAPTSPAEPAAAESTQPPEARPAAGSTAAVPPTAAEPAPPAVDRPQTPPPPAEQPRGLSFSGPMVWILIGAAAIILVLALAQ